MTPKQAAAVLELLGASEVPMNDWFEAISATRGPKEVFLALRALRNAW